MEGILDPSSEVSYKALMMAVGNYQLEDFDPLPATQNDVQMMKQLLQNSLFSDCDDMTVVTPKYEATESEMIRDAIKVLKAKVKRDFNELIPQVIFIYFSGHGIIKDGKSYGVDIDGKMIPLTDLIDDLNEYNTYVIGIFDCCRVQFTEEQTTQISSKLIQTSIQKSTSVSADSKKMLRQI